jgi:VWFA-related protein
LKPSGVALLFLAGNAAFAQQPAVIRAETKVVLVDVVVTDKKGGYIQDLNAKDFRVWEDGKEQAIQSFALVSSAPAAAVAASRTDYMVLALDYGGMGTGDQSRARQAALRFIDANVSPNRRMAVANLYRGFEVLQGFTDNAGRLKDAVNLASASVVNPATAPANGRARGAGTAAGDLGTRNTFMALKGLSELASSLGQAQGRKTIVLLTGSSNLPNSQKSVLAELIEACNRSNVVIYPVDVQDPFMSASPDASSNAGASAGTASTGGKRGGGGGNSGFDPDALSTDPNADNLQFLLAMASGTGGFLIRNSGELLEGMQKIGEEQDRYYVLGYTPPESKEGACHALRVKVDRGGVTARARPNYCPEEQHDLVALNAAERNLEKRAVSAETPAIAASMQLPFFYASPGVARVHAALEIQPGAIKLEKKKDGLHADVSVLGIASAAGGGTAARFTDTMTVNVAEADFERWKQTPLRYERQFKIAPGEYTFTVVFSAGGDSFGKLEQRLVIEPYQTGQFAMSGLALSREIRKAGAAGESTVGSLFDERTPLLSAGVELIPSGSAVFIKSDHVYCYFEVYRTAAVDPTVSVRILNAKTGQPAEEGGTSKIEPPANGKNTIPVALMVATSALAPGAYLLEATATDGANSTSRTVAFEIK